jgi:hypothetical protein
MQNPQHPDPGRTRAPEIQAATAINNNNGRIVANATDNHTLPLTQADHPAHSARSILGAAPE